MEEIPPTEGGVTSVFTRILRTLRDVAENRLELLVLELKEERARLLAALLLAAAIIICALMALVVLTFTIVVVFWDTHRLLTLVLLLAAYAGAAAAAFVKLRARLRRWEPLNATREQLKKDRALFKTENG